jgi:hypothetical protein
MPHEIERRADFLRILSSALPVAALVVACSSPEPTDDGGAGGSSGSASAAGRGGSSVGGAPGTGGSSSGGSLGSGAVGGVGGAAGNPSTAGTGGSLGSSGGTTSSGGTAGMFQSGGSGGTVSVGGGGGTAGSAGTAGPGTGGTGGSTGGTGAAGSGGTGAVTFDKPAGTIQNSPQPATKVDLDQAEWQQGLISPTLLGGHQLSQPTVMNGYLMMCGNEEFWIYDISNATAPRELSSFSTPNRRVGGEAESHTQSFARYGDKFYMVTVGGTGIDTWDVTDPTQPEHMAQLKIPGVNYGDYTEAVWGVSWQGQYIYVGATNNGIKVVDATDPADLEIAGEVPTSQFGGVSAGPVDAIGNILVVTTPKESGGVATLDITDPIRPVRLASFTTSPASYIGSFYKHYAVLLGPVRVWDVLTNPRSIGTGNTPVGTLNTPYTEYMTFSDNVMFIGHARKELGGDNIPGASRIAFSDPRSLQVTDRIWGRLDTSFNDDQFVMPMGNLLVLTDDQTPYKGWVIAVHQAAPDATAPVVDTVIPKNDETGVSIKSRIGITFSDNIELATVNAASFIVRPVGGAPLPGKYGVRMGVVNFDPDGELQPATKYEVVLPQGGIADFVGNTLANDWTASFTTE